MKKPVDGPASAASCRAGSGRRCLAAQASPSGKRFGLLARRLLLSATRPDLLLLSGSLALALQESARSADPDRGDNPAESH